MTFELDRWPKIQARNYGNVNGRSIRVLVIHDMESPEDVNTAENVAKWFAGSDAPKASAHLCIDSNSIVRCVDDMDVAYHAPGANNDGIGFELAGKASQSEAQWLDTFGKAMLENAAKAAAQYSVKYGIPVVHLTNSELGAGRKGLVGHRQVSSVYNKSDHSDPGANFPWTYFMQRINYWLPFYKNNRAWPSKPAPADSKILAPGHKIPGDTVRWLGLMNPPMVGQDVKNAQNVLLMAGNPSVQPEYDKAVYGQETAKYIGIFKENRGIVEAGVGPKTWAALRDYAH